MKVYGIYIEYRTGEASVCDPLFRKKDDAVDFLFDLVDRDRAKSEETQVFDSPLLVLVINNDGWTERSYRVITFDVQ